MSRFVILEHDHPVLHWDLMLEDGETLRTWRVERPPKLGETIAATPLGQHRRHYLDYEGPVSGNRGHVRRWDAGDFIWQWQDENRVVVELAGEKAHGCATLERLSSENWSFTLAKSLS
jgi:hypothetical protein